MDEVSLQKAIQVIGDALLGADINDIDKVELLLNIKRFLDPVNYQRNIEVLRQNEETIKRK